MYNIVKRNVEDAFVELFKVCFYLLVFLYYFGFVDIFNVVFYLLVYIEMYYEILNKKVVLLICFYLFWFFFEYY